MEKQRKHILAMKHFISAFDLDPTYISSKVNMEQYGVNSEGSIYCAYDSDDCHDIRKYD